MGEVRVSEGKYKWKMREVAFFWILESLSFSNCLFFNDVDGHVVVTLYFLER